MEYKDKTEFRVLIVEPQKSPYAAEIDLDLDILQTLVGGSIQFVPLDRHSSLYRNAEGKLQGLPGNRRLDNGDIVTGTFVIFYDDGTRDNASLTDEQVERYMRRFKEPEQFSYQQVKDIGLLLSGLFAARMNLSRHFLMKKQRMTWNDNR